MSRTIAMALLAAGVVVFAGCNHISGVPALSRAEITPELLQPGTDAVITVHAVDTNDIIDRVEGVVVGGDREVNFKLHDNGEPPDKKAGDDVWTIRVEVPFQAPPGEFLLEFTAYREDGSPVPIRDRQQNVRQLSITLPIVISYPDAEPQGAAAE